MKKIVTLLTCMFIVFDLSISAQAILIDNFDGTVTDTDRSIMWLQDANYALTSGFDTDGLMNWNIALSFVGAMNAGIIGNFGFTDWRLPTTLVPDPSCSGFATVGGTPIRIAGTNCSGSEMGHLFYDELGGSAGQSILTSVDPDLGLFSNINAAFADFYWSGTDFVSEPIAAAEFNFNDGTQQVGHKINQLQFAWAVRDVTTVAPIPEPSTILLLGSGLVGLVGYNWRRRKQAVGISSIEPQTGRLKVCSKKMLTSGSS